MKKFYIIKIGTTFPTTLKQFGDFDRWTAQTLGPVEMDLEIVDAEHGASLPKEDRCAGVVITGSHAMVTDNIPWSVRLEKWIGRLIATRTPLLGICYGHQLLARAAGGTVGFHPRGREIGTVRVRLLPGCSGDPLFQGLGDVFMAHATHAQTVLTLPPTAIRLAAGDHDPHQAFRIGKCAWGVQFHPEYTADIMRAYIREQADVIASAGSHVSDLLQAVSETPIAAGVLKRFGRWVAEGMV